MSKIETSGGENDFEWSPQNYQTQQTVAGNGPNSSRLSGSSEGVRKQLGKEVDMGLQVLVDKRGLFIKGKTTVTEGSRSVCM